MNCNIFPHPDFSGSSQFLTNVIIGVTVTIFIVFIVVPIIICIIVAVCVCGVCGSVGTSSGHHIHSRAVAPATTTSTFISTSSTGQQVAYPSAYPVTPPPPYYTIQPDPPKYNWYHLAVYSLYESNWMTKYCSKNKQTNDIVMTWW